MDKLEKNIKFIISISCRIVLIVSLVYMWFYWAKNPELTQMQIVDKFEYMFIFAGCWLVIELFITTDFL